MKKLIAIIILFSISYFLNLRYLENKIRREILNNPEFTTVKNHHCNLGNDIAKIKHEIGM